MQICGYEWYARLLLPPDGRNFKSVKQICILNKDHDGDHKSSTKVTVENKKER